MKFIFDSEINLDKISKSLKTNRKVKIFEILFLFFLAFIFIWFFESNKSENIIYNQVLLWVANIFMLIYIYIGIKLRDEKLSDYGLSIKKFNFKYGLKTISRSFLIFIIALIMFIIGSIIMANIVGIPEPSSFSEYNYLKENTWALLLTLLGVYIASSFGEEIIYRVFLINRIEQLKLNKHLVIFISSIVFGFIHYSWGAMGVVQTLLMGLALGYSYLYLKKNIWVIILAHMYMDTILFIQIYWN